MIQDIFNGPIVMFVVLDLCMIWALCPRRCLPQGKLMTALSVIASAAFGALACLVAYYFVDSSNASTAIQSPMCIGLMFLLARFVQGQQWQVALYCAIWSQLTTDIVAQIAYPCMNRVYRALSLQNQNLEIITILVSAAAALVIGKLFLAKQLQVNGDYRMNKRKALVSVFFCCAFLLLGNYQFIYFLMSYEPANQSSMVEVFRLMVGGLCFTALYLQNDMEKRQLVQQDLAIVRQLCSHQQEQYQLSKENIDLINRKCHDLKRQIAALRLLRDPEEIRQQMGEMEHAVGIYDAVVKTGNTVLDVVLTEKMLYCEANGINMTCLVDGRQLNFVNELDLYTMLSNVLDNAIESVMTQEDRQKRIIQVAGYSEKQLLLLRVRNFCDRPPELVDGLPVTTKEDKEMHGFGMKSIQFTARKYNGDITVRTDSNSFTVEILLPLPAAAAET